jgi:hypothetical protein
LTLDINDGPFEDDADAPPGLPFVPANDLSATFRPSQVFVVLLYGISGRKSNFQQEN